MELYPKFHGHCNPYGLKNPPGQRRVLLYFKTSVWGRQFLAVPITYLYILFPMCRWTQRRPGHADHSKQEISNHQSLSFSLGERKFNLEVFEFVREGH